MTSEGSVRFFHLLHDVCADWGRPAALPATLFFDYPPIPLVVDFLDALLAAPSATAPATGDRDGAGSETGDGVGPYPYPCLLP